MNFFDRIDQPTLLINESTARKNIGKMAQKVKQAGVRFRPHFKTHQSAEVGEWFREQGVKQITVSSVEMAEYFAEHNWNDIMIAFSLNLRQMHRIASLAKHIHLGLLVANMEAIEALSQMGDFPVDVWIKVDAGGHRTGIDWQDTPKVERLIHAIQASPELHLRGLLTHSGNTYHINEVDGIVKAFREGVDRMNELRNALVRKGISGLEISVGDTPGCTLCDDFSGIDELRPGNFVFYDAQQFQAGVCTTEDIAVAVACPVVAIHPDRREVVIYGGAIHLSKDFLVVGGEPGYGLVAFVEDGGWGKPVSGAIVRSLSQEHGVLRFDDDSFARIKIGDLIFILPAHSCLTVQAMKKYLSLSGSSILTMNQE